MTRARLKSLFKVLVSLSLLAWLLYTILRGEGAALLMDRAKQLKPWPIALAVLCQFGAVALGVFRYRRLLGLLGLERSKHFVAYHYLVGRFLGTLTPSTTGLDVTRVVSLTRSGADPLVATATVVVEKIYGLLGLSLTALLALPLGASRFFGDSALGLSVAALLASLALLFVVQRPAWLHKRLPQHGRLASRLGPLLEALERLHPTVPEHLLLSAFSTGSHLLTAGCYVASAYALGLALPFFELLAVGVGVVIALLVPVSVAGIGVREGVLVVLLRTLGVGAPEALLTSFIGFAATQPPALLGGLLLALGAQPAMENAPGPKERDQ